MTLLAPLSAIIAAGIGGSLLLVMYMLRLRRRPVRVSTIMFWSDPPKDLEANIPLRMIRPAWTLLLQALAIALLALALGRPAINADAPSSDRLYIVIDRSASMAATDAPDGRSRLDQAKARARDLIRNVGGLAGSRAMVIALASRAEALSPMSADRGVLTAALDSIQPTDEPGNLTEALDLVSALVASQAGEGLSASGARIVLLSDGAFTAAPTRPLAGAALDYQPVGAQAEHHDNLAIAALAAERDITDPVRIRVFARVLSVRAEPTPVTLTLELEGPTGWQELARRPLTLPAAVGADAGPAEQSVSIEFLRPSAAVLRATLDRPDDLASDNAAAVIIPPVRRPAILLIAPGRPDAFLAAVLEEIAPGRVRTLTQEQYDSAAAAEAIDAADLIVFDRVRPARAPDAPTLSIGATIPTPGLDSPVQPGSPDDAGPTGAATWDRTHPALADITLDSLLVSDPIPLGDGPRRELAIGASGPLIAEARDGPNRRIVVAFALHDSNWPVSVSFPIFLAAAVDHLIYAGSPGRAESFRAGEPISAAALGLADDAELVILSSTGDAVARAQGTAVVPRAGLYSIRLGPEARPIAVNIGDESESRLSVRPEIAVSGETIPASAAGDAPRELWPWFVLAAAIVLMLEWLVYLAVARA